MLKTLAMLSCTVGLAGCMSSNVLLTVRPDGSGTLEHTMQVRPSAMAAVEKLLSPGAVPAPTTRGRQPAWGEPLPQFAEGEWGRGVRQRRTRSLKSGDTVGWVTTYDVDNVTTLDLDLLPHDVTLDFQNPATQTPAPVAAPPRAGAPAPDTEIFLAPLSSANGTLTVGTPANITNSPGYDNQPAFTPDGRSILFSSVRGVAPAASSPAASTIPPAIPATDIYRYDIASKQIARVTSTPEGEFSPTVMPDGGHISVIRVEADGTQRLWSFTIDGKSPALLLIDVKPVGYHAWIDDHTLALFILGDRSQPATLQVADTTTGKAEVITRDIGTSIKRMPSGAISFVQREPRTEGAPRAAATAAQEAGVVTIKQLNVKGAERVVSALVRPVPGATQPDLAWMPDGTLLMAYGGTLYRWRAGDTDWTAVANLDALGLRVVTRLAVSPGGDRIAIVGQSR